ncbi:hypothetical protein ACTPC6_17510 [Clostridioides difficile]
MFNSFISIPPICNYSLKHIKVTTDLKLTFGGKINHRETNKQMPIASA